MPASDSILLLPIVSVLSGHHFRRMRADPAEELPQRFGEALSERGEC